MDPLRDLLVIMMNNWYIVYLGLHGQENWYQSFDITQFTQFYTIYIYLNLLKGMGKVDVT